MPINVTERGVMPPDQTGGQLGQGTATAPALVTENAGYQLVDSTNPYTLRFSIPLSLVLVRRARLSFSLMKGVYSLQSGTAAGGTTGNENQNHWHAMQGNTSDVSNYHSHGGGNHQHVGENHQHATFVADATSNAILGMYGPVARDGNNTYFGIIPNGNGSTTYKTDSSGAVWTRAGSGGVQTGGENAGHVHAQSGTTGWINANHDHGIPGVGVTIGAPVGLAKTASVASGAYIYLSTNGGAPVLIKPIPTQVQPPYNAPSYNDLDLSAYFAKVPATYELTISSATLGGIMAQMQLTGELTAA